MATHSSILARRTPWIEELSKVSQRVGHGLATKQQQLYSTGNCIQYSVINHNGKNIKKGEYIKKTKFVTIDKR